MNDTNYSNMPGLVSINRAPSRKNNRRNNRKNSRKNNMRRRKQHGGDSSGIFHSRIAGPAAFIIRKANELVGDEVAAARKILHGAFDGLANAVEGVGHVANGAVRGLARVVTRKNRRNNRKH
jgi:hypothetical protein